MNFVLFIHFFWLHSSPDNKQFASCGGDKTVFLFDTTAGIVNKKFLGHNGKVNAVCFNEDASILASGKYFLPYSTYEWLCLYLY